MNYFGAGKQNPRMRKHVIIASALALAFCLLLSLTLILFLPSGSSSSSNGSSASPASNGGGGSTTQSGNSSSGEGADFTTADWLGLITAVGTLASGLGAVITVVKSRNGQVVIAAAVRQYGSARQVPPDQKKWWLRSG